MASRLLDRTHGERSGRYRLVPCQIVVHVEHCCRPAYALAKVGERGAAKRVLDALLAAPQRSYLPPVSMAKAYVALNDADAAFAWLQRGYDERAAQMRTIKVTPGFDPLHADPRWAPLLRRMGLEA